MMTRSRKVALGALVAALGVLGVVLGVAGSPGITEPVTATTAPVTANTTDAIARIKAWNLVQASLGQLPVKGRAPMTGYDNRKPFGPAWTDDTTARGGHNHCDTRDDMLNLQLKGVKKFGSCEVLSGTLLDPYTGKTINFTRGVGTSTAVQIDHVVSLGNAWATGAQQLTPEQRVALANDPDNLQATDGPTNQAKGDGDAATWLPPQRSYWCTYAARQVLIKNRYKLWTTQAEHDKLGEILRGCM